MGSDHLSRLAAPKTWEIKRKGIKYITKPVPGPHKMEAAMPLGVLLKEVLKYAATTKEVKKILNSNDIKIDGITRKDFRFSTGLFDAVELIATNECFRFTLNSKGKLHLVKIKKEESASKPCKITGKTMVNGKLQLNLYDGKNVFAENKSYKVGDTVMLTLPDQKIAKHLKLDKKATIFLTGGKHIGEVGNVEDIISNKIIYKDSNNNLIETLKEYAFVVGEEKPLITLS